LEITLLPTVRTILQQRMEFDQTWAASASSSFEVSMVDPNVPDFFFLNPPVCTPLTSFEVCATKLVIKYGLSLGLISSTDESIAALHFNLLYRELCRQEEATLSLWFVGTMFLTYRGDTAGCFIFLNNFRQTFGSFYVWPRCSKQQPLANLSDLRAPSFSSHLSASSHLLHLILRMELPTVYFALQITGTSLSQIFALVIFFYLHLYKCNSFAVGFSVFLEFSLLGEHFSLRHSLRVERTRLSGSRDMNNYKPYLRFTGLFRGITVPVFAAKYHPTSAQRRGVHFLNSASSFWIQCQRCTPIYRIFR
jgi:hypothetical protein